jgi:hypothetical protein
MVFEGFYSLYCHTVKNLKIYEVSVTVKLNPVHEISAQWEV